MAQEMMSLSYQLEILWYQVGVLPSDSSQYIQPFLQAERMRALGWANYMSVQMTRDRKSMTVSYWL